MLKSKPSHWEDLPEIISAEDLADFLGCHKDFVYQRAREGVWPKVPAFGRLVRFSKPRLRSIFESGSLKTEESSIDVGSYSEPKELRWL